MQKTIQAPPSGQEGLWAYCLRKQRYSQKAARKEAFRRNQKRLPSEPELVFYPCTNCDRHHVGHKSRN